jgi:hypothetical protein
MGDLRAHLGQRGGQRRGTRPRRDGSRRWDCGGCGSRSGRLLARRVGGEVFCDPGDAHALALQALDFFDPSDRVVREVADARRSAMLRTWGQDLGPRHEAAGDVVVESGTRDAGPLDDLFAGQQERLLFRLCRCNVALPKREVNSLVTNCLDKATQCCAEIPLSLRFSLGK